MTPYLLLLSLCLPMTLAIEAALEEFASANNLFTSSVYKEIAKNGNGNFLVSPVSAETILALTHSGAKEATAEELRTALHLPNSRGKIHAAFGTLSRDLDKSGLYTLRSANKIYVKNNFALRDEFKRTAVNVFDAELEKIDFNQREIAARNINDWVEGRTEHKIKNLVKPEILNSQTRAILVNALYFKANWSSPFEHYQTVKKDFHRNGNEVVQVDTMQDGATHNYYEDKELGAKFLELPFEGGDVTFTVVLPNGKNGLPRLENQLQKVLASPKYAQEYVKIALPKFKIETELDFKKLLQQLGVNKIFREEEADLSGIAGEKGDLVVDRVLQKTFVEVAEKGVEAAAATYAAVGIPLSGSFAITPPKEFKADHPFIFYIKLKDMVLFAGRFVGPSP